MAETKAAMARRINDTIRYMQISVFALDGSVPGNRQETADEVQRAMSDVKGDLVTRGWYDVGGLRADADLMVWWHADSSEALQEAYHGLRSTTLGRQLRPVWSVQALHRPAEFNKSHIPAFMAEEDAHNWLCVYPFVRSYEWYLLTDEERRELLAEHGGMARGYPDVRANTVATFALSDYEWLLAFEADELHRIVDLMRHLRGSRARLHVREEIPFYTGRRWDLAELLQKLP
ncbi:MAG: hydrogen peroxide-dependent heme synthase [Candidatus Nanopelagicales bacterium]